MKSGQGSRTAEGAAALRASHTLYADPKIFEDPYAYALTSPRWQRLLKNRPLNRLVARLLLRRLAPITAQVVARSRYTEDRLATAVARGVAQYVMVGAGLDSFTLRRRDLEQTLRVFEVDHADTQGWKRQRLARLTDALPRNLEFVAVDFERESLAQALRRSAYRTEVPAFYSWLGTTHYLTPAATLATLESITTIAAPGSELVFDYSLPRELIPAREQRAGGLLRRYTARQGEPMIGQFVPEQLHGALTRLGFEVVEDLSGAAQAQRYFANRDDGLHPTQASHFLHARLLGPVHRYFAHALLPPNAPG
ncbi:MAG: class I SAM-dependent methyltransferase [Pseudomonadota bacterium]